MTKIVLIPSMILGIFMLLSGCSHNNSEFKEPVDSTTTNPHIVIADEEEINKYDKFELFESAAKLYVEILWRDVADSDKIALSVCDVEVQEKILENAKFASETRRKSSYYTKEELMEMLNLDENGQENSSFDDSLAPQMAGFIDPSQFPEYNEQETEKIVLVSKDKYEVKRVSNNSGLITLDNGNIISVPISKEYSGEINISIYQNSYEDYGTIVYKVEFDEETIYLYVDIENDFIVRIREKLYV